MRVKEYFTDDELRCKCGCRKAPDRRFVERVYAMRLILGFPIPVSSGARCTKYNKEVGGEDDSSHLVGAIDVDRYEIKNEGLMIEAAIKVGMTGIGFQDNKMLHFDDKHEILTFWGYGE